MLLPLLLGSFLTFGASSAQAVCGNPPVVWRNFNMTCPTRAVCADVFTTARDWYNGTRCEERRVLHNCLCPDQTVCPFNDPDHRLYSTSDHMQFLCRPVCQLPYCGNIHLVSTDGRSPMNVAQTVEQNDPGWGNRSYYKIDCRCPRHHTPYVQPPRIYRAVHAHSQVYIPLENKFSTRFVCTLRDSERSMADPCPRVNAVDPQ